MFKIQTPTHQNAPVYPLIDLLQQTIHLKSDQLSVLSVIGTVPVSTKIVPL